MMQVRYVGQSNPGGWEQKKKRIIRAAILIKLYEMYAPITGDHTWLIDEKDLCLYFEDEDLTIMRLNIQRFYRQLTRNKQFADEIKRIEKKYTDGSI